MSAQQGVLLVANWDSGVGYAWWLMESFWMKLAERYHHDHRVLLAYHSISTLSKKIQAAPLEPVVRDLRRGDFSSLVDHCRFLRRNNVRLIYFSDWGTWNWRYPLFRLCGVKRIVIHDHTPGERVAPRGLKRWLKRMLNRLPWLAADGAIGATDYVRQRLENVSCFPAVKCFSVPNGLPRPGDHHDADEVSVRDLFSIPSERAIMVMTGRANRYKNVSFVIDCMAELLRAGRQELHFLFIGDGPDLEAFKAQAASLGVSAYCSFPGRRSDVPQVLPGCDFAVHPSRGEVGYSLSILEYMQAGLPVIVPDNPSVCGATTEGETGLVYTEYDDRSAVLAISRLLEDEDLRRKMGAKCVSTVAEKFSLARTHDALLSAFDCIDPVRSPGDSN